ncbi:MAG: hypothetical protein GY822_00780 [Deltaproteobacteria bacterium]|nr:hypothetical protein [Deltaproteobacteria bacterium]
MCTLASLQSISSGGFLLATEAAGYRQRITEGEVWVMDDGEVQGSAIVLPDAAFRKSEVWTRRHHVKWTSEMPEDQLVEVANNGFVVLTSWPCVAEAIVIDAGAWYSRFTLCVR